MNQPCMFSIRTAQQSYHSTTHTRNPTLIRRIILHSVFDDDECTSIRSAPKDAQQAFRAMASAAAFEVPEPMKRPLCTNTAPSTPHASSSSCPFRPAQAKGSSHRGWKPLGSVATVLIRQVFEDASSKKCLNTASGGFALHTFAGNP